VARILASAGALTTIALMLSDLCWRIRDEEARLAREFPAEWTAYHRKTARLIPYVF
jgi:protein-S-isoprenylcysteine O-methyltransferase Ste14